MARSIIKKKVVAYPSLREVERGRLRNLVGVSSMATIALYIALLLIKVMWIEDYA